MPTTGAMSDYLELEALDHTLGTEAYATPASVHVALFTTAPTDAGGGVEVSGNGYSRQVATFGAASGGSASNSAALTFTASGGAWGTIVALAIFDAASGGNMLYRGNLEAAKTIGDGDSLRFAIGELQVSLN